jgi:hypothetical protein
MLALTLVVAGCSGSAPSASGGPTGSAPALTQPAGSPTGASRASPVAATPGSPSAAGGSSPANGHGNAINVCGLLDEAAASSLLGFPVTYFGPGDPLARVPLKDIVGLNRAGVPTRTAGCGYWETGTTVYDSRSLTVRMTQGDPGKPGTWSVDTAKAQYAVVESVNAGSSVQEVSGLGDQAFALTTPGSARVVCRSGDLILDVEVDWGSAKALSLDTLQSVARAVLAKV